jgi:hypothetical protein
MQAQAQAAGAQAASAAALRKTTPRSLGRAIQEGPIRNRDWGSVNPGTGEARRHWSVARAAFAQPAPADEELLRLLQLRLESLQALQAELPHAAQLVLAGGGSADAAEALLKDIGETMELVQEKLVDQASSSRHKKAKLSTVAATADKLMITKEIKEAPKMETRTLRDIVPASVAKRHQRVAVSHITDTCMELFNEAGDVLFAAELWSHHSETGEHEARWLFWLAVLFILLTTIVRLAIARLVFWPRVRADQRSRFAFAVVIYMVEPASGQQLLKRTLQDHEEGGVVFVAGKGYVTMERDAVAVRAANELVAGRAEVRTVIALVGSEDAPGFLIQLSFLLLYSTGISYVWYLSTAGTVLHIARQLLAARSTYNRLPALQYMAEGRDRTFAPGKEANDAEVEQFAARYNTEVRIVSLARTGESPGDGFGNGAVLALAQHCPNLRGINLNLCKRVQCHAVVAMAAQCAQLQNVNLGGCSRMTEKAVIAVANRCAQLQSVNLSECSGATDKALVALALNCIQLQSINLSGCFGVTGHALETVATHCTQLQNVYLSGCRGATSEALIALARHCVQLQSVDLSGCSNGVTGESLVALATHCAQLQNIFLSGCYHVTSEALVALAAHCTQLQKVGLGGCVGVDQEAVMALAAHCAQLQNVDFTSCARVTGESLVALATNCTQLQHIGLGCCKGVTNKVVVALATHCTQLHSVDLTECTRVTDESLVALARHCEHLQNLYLGGCPGVTDEVVMALATHCPDLEQVILLDPDLKGGGQVTDNVVAQASAKLPSCEWITEY